jgi:serine/threonine protein kinase
MELTQLDPQVIANHCPGLVIGDQLKIGGQKRVWKCAFQQRAYVLKALKGDEATLRRVRREIEVMHACESRYLPQFGPLPLQQLDLPGGQRILYFLEQYVDGLPLRSVTKPMPVQEIVALARCVSEALRVLASTKRYVHRDVKPENIIQKTPSEYVLIDAGLALDPDGEAITAPGAVVGTRMYLSPDQLTLSQGELDVRSDLFALGVVLYEEATGEHPFWNDEAPRGDVIQNILNFECAGPRHFNPELPGPLCDVIMRLVHKDRNARYSNVDELQAALNGDG